jgi:histone arginine demethylase JMJD6
MLTHLTDTWKALTNWAPDSITKLYGDYEMDVGASDYEYMTIASFIEYTKAIEEGEHPKYLFDSAMHRYPDLVSDFSVPDLFTLDFLDFLDVENRFRPDWRWFLVGGRGSGFALHIDPHYTSAWNALIVGEKRWVLIPNESTSLMESILAEGEGEMRARERDIMDSGKKVCEDYFQSAQHWFDVKYPILKPHEERLGMVETVQVAGDTIFIPALWHHVAISTELTVGVTQNYLSRHQFLKRALRNYYGTDRDGAMIWFHNLPEVEKEGVRNSDLKSLFGSDQGC